MATWSWNSIVSLRRWAGPGFSASDEHSFQKNETEFCWGKDKKEVNKTRKKIKLGLPSQRNLRSSYLDWSNYFWPASLLRTEHSYNLTCPSLLNSPPTKLFQVWYCLCPPRLWHNLPCSTMWATSPLLPLQPLMKTEAYKEVVMVRQLLRAHSPSLKQFWVGLIAPSTATASLPLAKKCLLTQLPCRNLLMNAYLLRCSAPWNGNVTTLNSLYWRN